MVLPFRTTMVLVVIVSPLLTFVVVIKKNANKINIDFELPKSQIINCSSGDIGSIVESLIKWPI